MISIEYRELESFFLLHDSILDGNWRIRDLHYQSIHSFLGYHIIY